MALGKRLIFLIVLSATFVAILIGWFVLDPRFENRVQEEKAQEAGDTVPEDALLDALLAKVAAEAEQARRGDRRAAPGVKDARAGFNTGIEAEISSSDELEWRSAYDSLLREIASGKPDDLASSGKNIVYLMNVYLYHESSDRQQYSAAILYNLALTNRFVPEDEAMGFPELSEYEWLKDGLFHVATNGYTSESRRMGIETYASVFGMDEKLYDFVVSNYGNAAIREKQSYVLAAYYGATGPHHTDEKRAYAEEILRIAVNDPEAAVSERAKSLICASGNEINGAERFDLLQGMESECDRQ